MTPKKLENFLHFLYSASKVAEFYYKDEKKHYEECNKKKNHIFNHIKRMKEFLKIEVV